MLINMKKLVPKNQKKMMSKMDIDDVIVQWHNSLLKTDFVHHRRCGVL